MTTRSTRESTHMWKNQLMKTRKASSKTPRCLPYLFIFFLSSFFSTLLPNLLSKYLFGRKVYCITLKYEIEMMEPLKINFPESQTKQGKYLFSAETFLTVEIYIACFSFIFTSLFVCLMGTAQII